MNRKIAMYLLQYLAGKAGNIKGPSITGGPFLWGIKKHRL
jgi:hypothetical protein